MVGILVGIWVGEVGIFVATKLGILVGTFVGIKKGEMDGM